MHPSLKSEFHVQLAAFFPSFYLWIELMRNYFGNIYIYFTEMCVYVLSLNLIKWAFNSNFQRWTWFMDSDLHLKMPGMKLIANGVQ